MRQLLKNAKIYDGTGAEPYQADILLEDDRIAKIAGNIDLPADQVYDLAEKSVSSGFIDAHSHNDWFAIKKDPLPYFSPFLRQGITTFITGNCGIILLGFGFRDIQIAYIGPGYEKYEGKTVHFKGKVMIPNGFQPNSFIPGRNAMTCCVNDIRFIGFICHSRHTDKLRQKQWIEVTAEIRYERRRKVFCGSYGLFDELVIISHDSVHTAQSRAEYRRP